MIFFENVYEELKSKDKVLSDLIDNHGPMVIDTSKDATRFEALVRSVLHQQLTRHAADAIYSRVVQSLGSSLTPQVITHTELQTLRSCGLSQSKALAIQGLAQAITEKKLDLQALDSLSDLEVFEELSAYRGIGIWTAQMFCIFQLKRLDIWPSSDYGVRKGFSKAYCLEAIPSAKELEQIGDRFRPYRTILAWYCWRAAESDKKPTQMPL